MITKKEVEENYIFKTKIELGEYFKKPQNEVYIVLREPESREYLKIRKSLQQSNGETDAVLENFIDLFPDLIIDHAFYDDTEGKKKTSNTEVAKIITQKIEVLTQVMTEYLSSLPLQTESSGK